MVNLNDIRTIDGEYNQVDGEGNPLGEGIDNGNTGAALVRLFDPAYEDGISEPRGGGLGEEESTLPNAREISNAIAAQGNVTGNPFNASDWLWQWAQFLDHDLSLSEGTNILRLDEDERAEFAFNIPLPEGDILRGANFTAIPVSRVEPLENEPGQEGEPRQVANEITAYIDGSNGYGSTYLRAAAKRTDLGNSFFGLVNLDGEGEIETDENGNRFLVISNQEDLSVENEGVDGPETEAEEQGSSSIRIFLPPEGQSPYDGKLLVANNSYGTNGVAFESGSDPNNTSGEILPPYNRANSPNADPDPDPDSSTGGRVPNDQEFISGDVRINEQSGLIAIHTLLVREHNRIADKVTAHLNAGDDEGLNQAYAQFRDVYVPGLLATLPEGQEVPEPTEEQIRGEFIYEAARAVVGAKSQIITYEEFLPILVGNENAADLETIQLDEELLSPGIAKEFSGAAYRLGHTLLSDNIRTVDDEGLGSISLREAFFTPQAISAQGVDEILIGLNYQQSNDVDTRVIDGVRNNLFGPPGSGGLDLVAINIQRGRDLGLPGYVAVYNNLNPDAPITSFADLIPIFGSEELVASFERVYESVDQIDLWIGGLAEVAIEGALLGPTIGAIVSDQFARLRDYDRFFYEDQLANPESFLSTVYNAIGLNVGDVRLADIIRDNVSHPELVPDDAFTVPFEREIRGTVNSDRNGNTINGTEAADLIDGLSGDDSILGGEGDDIIFGGVGNDTLDGQAGADTLVGAGGNDVLNGQAGDVLNGGTGNDTYNVSVAEALGTQIADTGGDSDSLTLTDAEGASYELLTVDPLPNRTGIKKSGTDLQIDLDRNGILDPNNDLTIFDFFTEEGELGSGAIEQVANLTSEEILNYTQSDLIANGSTVYRFFNPSAGVHFYTASAGERDFVRDNLANYTYEGESYKGAPHDQDADELTGAKPVYRFLNVDTSVHLYTLDVVERDYILENLPNFNFEGVAYYGYDVEQPGTQPLYRFFNPQTGTHFYTPSAAERDNVIENLPNYQLEGDSGVTYYIQPIADV